MGGRSIDAPTTGVAAAAGCDGSHNPELATPAAVVTESCRNSRREAAKRAISFRVNDGPFTKAAEREVVKHTNAVSSDLISAV